MHNSFRRTTHKRFSPGIVWALLVWAVPLLVGCAGQPETPGAVPTVAPVFGVDAPAAAATMGPAQLVPTPRPPPDAVVSSRTGANLATVTIYDEALSDDWSLDESTLMRIDTRNGRFTQSGRYAIEAAPQKGYSVLFFTVQETTRRRYNADEILGVRFYVNGGPNAIGPEDLVITVLGSNAFPYWRPNDTSVAAAGRITDGGTIFDEQRIYFLGFENGIPAYTWAEVTVWFDERILDPEYTYFTGLYIKNDEFFVKPFFVDNVSLLVPRD